MANYIVEITVDIGSIRINKALEIVYKAIIYNMCIGLKFILC